MSDGPWPRVGRDLPPSTRSGPCLRTSKPARRSSWPVRAVRMGYEPARPSVSRSLSPRGCAIFWSLNSGNPSRVNDPESRARGKLKIDSSSAGPPVFAPREDLLRAFDLLTRARSRQFAGAAQPVYHPEMAPFLRGFICGARFRSRTLDCGHKPPHLPAAMSHGPLLRRPAARPARSQPAPSRQFPNRPCP